MSPGQRTYIEWRISDLEHRASWLRTHCNNADAQDWHHEELAEYDARIASLRTKLDFNFNPTASALKRSGLMDYRGHDGKSSGGWFITNDGLKAIAENRQRINKAWDEVADQDNISDEEALIIVAKKARVTYGEVRDVLCGPTFPDSILEATE